MIVARVHKENADIRRVRIDFASWLDPGETLSSLSSTDVIYGAGGWTATAPYPTVATVPYDPTPLLVDSIDLDTTSTQVVMFLIDGTPAATYTVRTTAFGTSGRAITFEVAVYVDGQAPTLPAYNVTTSLPLPSYLPLNGGTMLGPLYAFQSPQTSTEVATKAYVDAQASTYSTAIANEVTARGDGDDALQAAIDAEIARATGVEDGILLAKKIVAGAGLNGGTITLSGTTTVVGTLSADWDAGAVVTIGDGLDLTSGTLAANWRMGVVTAFGSGVSISSGTLSVGAGTVTEIVTGSGLTGGTITTSGTIAANWREARVDDLATGLVIASNTLVPQWQAGTITALGTGVVNNSGTLDVPIAPLVQGGGGDTDSSGLATVTFATAYSAAPAVALTVTGTGGLTAGAFLVAFNVTQYGFSVFSAGFGAPMVGDGPIGFSWIAVPTT